MIGKEKYIFLWPVNQYNQFRPFYTKHLYYETKGNKSYTAPSHFGKSGQFFWLRLLQPQAISGLRVTVHHGARITLQCVLSPPSLPNTSYRHYHLCYLPEAGKVHN